MSSYTTSIKIETSSERVFAAISQELGAWWGNQDKTIEQKSAIFKVAWGEPWYQFEVVAFQKNLKMVWECVDANQKINGLTGIEKEWVGTKIHWNLESEDDKLTVLNFRHEGLEPSLLCFEFCSKSWNHFLEESLVKYLSNANN